MILELSLIALVCSCNPRIPPFFHQGSPLRFSAFHLWITMGKSDRLHPMYLPHLLREVLTIKPIADFHRQAVAHAGRTTKKAIPLGMALEKNFCLALFVYNLPGEFRHSLFQHRRNTTVFVLGKGNCLFYLFFWWFTIEFEMVFQMNLCVNFWVFL